MLHQMADPGATPEQKLRARYERIASQLEQLYGKVRDPQSRMASAAALLHSKMRHHYWTGFYRLAGADLLVGPYQGPLACMSLERGQGVCWAVVAGGEPILVPDVHAFPGHIACDARSKSEVVVPVRDASGALVAVMDVDSEELDAFVQVDVDGLMRIAALIHS